MLARDADTWRPVHREAQGNALKPIAKRGEITKRYPLVVAVDQEQRAQVIAERRYLGMCRSLLPI